MRESTFIAVTLIVASFRTSCVNAYPTKVTADVEKPLDTGVDCGPNGRECTLAECKGQGYICCTNCLDPIPNAGECPDPEVIKTLPGLRCPRDCEFDSICGLHQKCCPSSCGGTMCAGPVNYNPHVVRAQLGK